jgi:hypothetical protein
MINRFDAGSGEVELGEFLGSCGLENLTQGERLDVMADCIVQFNLRNGLDYRQVGREIVVSSHTLPLVAKCRAVIRRQVLLALRKGAK